MTAAIIIGAAIAWLTLSTWLAIKLGKGMAWCDENRQ